MTIAIDPGAHAFRSLRRDGDQLVARRCRAVYATLPDTSAQRQLLDRAGVTYALCEGHLVLMGDPAAELARSFQTTCLDLLPGGIVPQADPVARQVAGLLVDALLPPARQPNELCCFTQPGHALRRHGGKSGQKEFFTQLIRLRGYTPVLVNAGMALIHAEMRAEEFTGLGISLGASGCEISMAHHGHEVLACSSPRGGQWIDRHVAESRKHHCWDACGQPLLDVELGRDDKEAATGSLAAPETRDDQLLAELYSQILDAVLLELSRELASHPRRETLPRRVSVICGGGLSFACGICELLRQRIEATELRIEVGEIRRASSADAIVRGCLINAELETEAARTRRATA